MLERRAAQREIAFDDRDLDQGAGLDPRHYFGILKRRFLYLAIPFVLVAVLGSLVAVLLPASYVSEGRILIESQSIPTELVRPTVSTFASERVQVIEQRIMTRDNLVAIADKFRVFGDWRQQMSGTDLLDKMRQRTSFRPFDIKRRNEGITIAFSVGFEHERPDIAAKVANELVTLVLNEDVRNRTARAVETTRFLGREVKRLEGELAAVEAKIVEARRGTGGGTDQIATQLATVRGEILMKSSLYADRHPIMLELKRQQAALEKLVVGAKAEGAAAGAGLETLERQQAGLQKDLETTSHKLSAARLGESLERDQQSERLEVIEQPTTPQKPIKPNRPKILALVLMLAGAAGGAGIVLVEMLDQTIRGRRDLAAIAGSHLIVTLPYVATRGEAAQKRKRLIKWAATVVIAGVLGTLVFHFLIYPIDQLVTAVFARLAR